MASVACQEAELERGQREVAALQRMVKTYQVTQGYCKCMQKYEACCRLPRSLGARPAWRRSWS